MKRTERWALRIGCLVATVTGVGYGYLRYFRTVNGEFGPEPHPWQGAMQHAHVVLVPLFVFALGFAARGHATGMLTHHVRRGRRTGIALLGLASPMILTGYVVQVVTQASTRVTMAWGHGIASMLFVGIYVFHWLKPHGEPRALVVPK